MFVRLSEEQLSQKIAFIENYIKASNAADGSFVDANANVTTKNGATLLSELHKDTNIQIQRRMICDELKKLYGEDIAKEYINQLKKHLIYSHDESGAILPYSYTSKEAITVKYNDSILLISFEGLYDYLNEQEIVVESGIFCKKPENLFVYDKDGKYTKVTVVYKKIRKTDIVRVKTAFGEDVYVTDNHPMIVKDDINDTIQAKDSENLKQYKQKCLIKFKNQKSINLKDIFENCSDYGSFLISNLDNDRLHSIKSTLDLTEEFGYFVGYFIGDGHYLTDSEQFVGITQLEKEPLMKLADILYRTTGISSKVYLEKLPPTHIKENRNAKHTLHVNNHFLCRLLSKFFGIGHLAKNKNIPINIFDTNEDFAKGVIAGLIDSDGTFSSDGAIQLRMASRYCISQMQTLLKYFKVSTGGTISIPNINQTSYIKQAYPMFGVCFNDKDHLFRMSEKLDHNKTFPTKGLKYQEEGWVTITKVDKIDNEYYLDQNEFVYDMTTDTRTFICNNLLVHNCVAVSLYPYLLNGLSDLGSDSKAPKHLKSYCDGVVQLVFTLSANFVGAVAVAEFLNFFDYFARKDYGDDYLTTHETEIKECLQGFVYQVNHPAASRGFQSAFTNISIFDKYFFDGLFNKFMFPDGTKSNWETFKNLQLFFLKWFNKERTKAILTFPVVTVAMISDKDHPKDAEFAMAIAKEMEEGNSFFIYQSQSADSLASCCRLANKIQDNTFHMSIGTTGVMTGSVKVMTLNMNRFLQDCKKKHTRNRDIEFMDFVKAELRLQIKKMHYFHVAFRNIIKRMIDGKILQAYTAGFITLDRQYSTIGINGMVEGAEALGYTPNNNREYIRFVSELLEVIKNENKDSLNEYGFRFNTEFVPAENLGVKNAYYDKLDGYSTERECYNSYFYPVEDGSIDIIDKFILHGREMTENLDGGSALHLNLEEHLTKEQYFGLMKIAIKVGCPYWTVNVKSTICNDCGNIDKRTLKACPKCKSKNLDYATRIIGYLKRISNFSSPRQKEESLRFYHRGKAI